jgi:hypothetical protein
VPHPAAWIVAGLIALIVVARIAWACYWATWEDGCRYGIGATLEELGAGRIEILAPHPAGPAVGFTDAIGPDWRPAAREFLRMTAPLRGSGLEPFCRVGDRGQLQCGVGGAGVGLDSVAFAWPDLVPEGERARWGQDAGLEVMAYAARRGWIDAAAIPVPRLIDEAGPRADETSPP